MLPTPEQAARENAHVKRMCAMDAIVKREVLADDERRLRDAFDGSQLEMEVKDTLTCELLDNARESLDREYESAAREPQSSLEEFRNAVRELLSAEYY